jgi:hypothetical protein
VSFPTTLVLAQRLTSNGLHRYLTDVVNTDIFWYIGSQLDAGPSTLPTLNAPIIGSSIVPWRYHFNTGKLARRFSPLLLVTYP